MIHVSLAAIVACLNPLADRLALLEPIPALLELAAPKLAFGPALLELAPQFSLEEGRRTMNSSSQFSLSAVRSGSVSIPFGRLVSMDMVFYMGDDAPGRNTSSGMVLALIQFHSTTGLAAFTMTTSSPNPSRVVT